MGTFEYVSKENGRIKTKFFDSKRTCKDCGKKLTPESWGVWAQKKHFYVCKACVNTRGKNKPSYAAARTTTTKKKIFPLSLSRKITNFQKDTPLRGIEITLTYKEIGEIMIQDCDYCGKKSVEGSWNSVDRIDSSKNYTHENVAPCCRQCNVGKGSYSKQEYIDHCERVLKKAGV